MAGDKLDLVAQGERVAVGEGQLAVLVALRSVGRVDGGRPGRARKLVSLLQRADLKTAGVEFYNSLEAPALEKYPLLALFQEFLRENGAAATLMSGSGSATFAVVQDQRAAEELAEKFKAKFGSANWMAVARV